MDRRNFLLEFLLGIISFIFGDKTVKMEVLGMDTSFNESEDRTLAEKIETLTRNLTEKTIKISPRKFGAVCDGISDDSDAINQAASYCKKHGYVLESAEKHFCAKTVTLACNCDLQNSTFIFDGTLPKSLIIQEASKMIENANMTLPIVINKSFTTTYPQDNIGIFVSGVKFSNLKFNSVHGFKVGVKIFSQWWNNVADDFTWNSVSFTSLLNNQTQLMLEVTNNGYINQNTFYDFMSSKWGTTDKSIDKQIVALNNTKKDRIDNNTFINCSFENGTDYGRENIVAEFKNVTNTTFVGGRYEIYNGNFITLDGGKYNLFMGGYNLHHGVFKLVNNPKFRIISGEMDRTFVGEAGFYDMSHFVLVPDTATAAGSPGDWSADANYLYICHSVNKWKRVTLAEW